MKDVCVVLPAFFSEVSAYSITPVQARNIDQPDFMCAGRPDFHLSARFPILECTIVACALMPLDPWHSEADIQCNQSGHHYVLLLLVNIPTITWDFSDKNIQRARGSARILLMDSLPSATTVGQSILIKEAAQELIAQAAARDKNVGFSRARELASGIPFITVSFSYAFISTPHRLVCMHCTSPTELRH